LLGLKDEDTGPESKGKMILCGLGERDEMMLAPFSQTLSRRSDIVMFSALDVERAMKYRTCSTQTARQSRCQVEINVGQPNYIKPISLGLWLLKKDGAIGNPHIH